MRLKIILKNLGIEIEPVEDTMLLSYTLDAGNNRHNLDTLSEIHLGHKTITYKELVGTGKKQLNFAEIEIEKATEYAAEDADVTLRLYEALKPRLDERYASALTKISNNRKIINKYGKIDLKDYVTSFIKGKKL